MGRRILASVAFTAIALLTWVAASKGNSPRSIVALPMDALPDAPFPDGLTTVVANAPFKTYRVNGESRAARVVRTPATIMREVKVPRGGGRLDTFFSPLTQSMVLSITVNDAPPQRFDAQPGSWTPVRVDLGTSSAPIHVVERLDGPAGASALWGQDRISPTGSRPAAPDVVVITLDTVRPDYLTPYAPAVATTPVLAQLAHQGTRFDQAISVSSWTTPAHAALFTGAYPRLGLGFTERLEPSALTLAEIFSAAGYVTIGRSGGPCIDSAFGFQQGFRTYHDSSNAKNAEEMTRWAQQRVTRVARGAPLFLFLNYFDAHELNSGVTGEEWQAAERGTVRLGGAPLEHLRAAYRFDIAAIDRQLGRLFDTIRQARDWDNTIVVVVGDHGQLLGERGFVGHGFTLDEELIRIPLIVKGLPSSGLAHHEYPEQVQISDVFTVILELAGLRPSGSGSLTHSIASGEPFRTLTFASYHQPARPEVTSLRRWVSETLEAVRTDSTKVVRDAEGHVTTYRVDGATQVAVPSSAIAERLLAELQAKHLEIAPARAGTLLPLPGDVADRLRALGYIH